MIISVVEKNEGWSKNKKACEKSGLGRLSKNRGSGEYLGKSVRGLA